MATYQSVAAGDRIEVAPHLARARASLRAAELLANSGLFADAAGRAHQACVHAERALLAVEKRSPPDVRSVHRMCTLHFLQNGQLDARHLAAIERLSGLRARADDLTGGTVAKDDAREAVDAAAGFLADVAAWLSAAGYR